MANGYVLESVRIGTSNSVYTASPDTYVTSSGSFIAAYPSDESVARAEYGLMVQQEGKIYQAVWGWTKNQGALADGDLVPFDRFGYAGADGRFQLFAGVTPVVLGVLGADSNTTRLACTPKPLLPDFTKFPVRVSTGSSLPGSTLTPVLVANDSLLNAPSPPVGSVQISATSGKLGWAPADLITYSGQTVRWQPQAYQEASNGLLGGTGSVLVLSPLPTGNQLPQIRLGYGLCLIPVRVSGDSYFSPNPSAGTVEWSGTSGWLKFNSEVAEGQDVFYTGTLLGTTSLLATMTTQGTPTAPTPVWPLPPVENDLFFRAGSHQFATTQRVQDFISTARDVVQVRTTDGALLFSPEDVTDYGALSLEAYHGVLPLEAGIGFRVFRCSADLGAQDSTIKDATKLASKVSPNLATWADPIIESPYIRLPAIPVEGEALQVDVQQSQGSFVGQLPNQITTPTQGVGYYFDYAGRQLGFCNRVVDATTLNPAPYATATLPPLLLGSSTLEYLPIGGSSYLPLQEGVDYQVDKASGVVTFTEQSGEVLFEGVGSVSSHVLQDTSQTFVSSVRGSTLEVNTGSANKTTLVTGYTATTLTVSDVLPNGSWAYKVRTPGEILADNYWFLVQVVDPTTSVTRLRGSTTTALVLGVDYRVTPELGFFDFKERFLTGDQLTIHYLPKGADTPITERGQFGVRKEESGQHLTPTSQVTFNPTAREVAQVLKVYRGGRPQAASQYHADLVGSTITFRGAATVTDALPSGPVISPSERILLDYQVFQALGGEKTLSTSQPLTANPVVLQAGSSSFTVPGDHTAEFVANALVRVAGEAIYHLSGSTYASGVTTVSLASGETFWQDWTNPTLEVSSGPVPLTPSAYEPPYLVSVGSYSPLPKGGGILYVPGDQALSLGGGTILCFGSQEWLQVDGGTYDAAANRTACTLSWGPLREYSSAPLVRSIRPILPGAPVQVHTANSRVEGTSFELYRKPTGAAGTLMATPQDYKVDAGGSTVLASPLGMGESLVAWYTGYNPLEPSTLKGSYQHVVTPSVENGLLGQILKASYVTLAPDTYYFRVEGFTAFTAELYQQYQAQAAGQSPSGGPIMDNSATPKLYQQGAGSLWFPERHLANQDLVASSALGKYHQAIEGLEDSLQSMDGRVVGDHSGRLLYDGILNNPSRDTWAQVTNQIDDTLKVSPAPYTVTGPPFVLVSVGTYAKAYEASDYSRFFPLKRNGYTAITVPATPAIGDPIGAFGWSPLASVAELKKHNPWAITTTVTAKGATTCQVDAGQGATEYLRPSFAASQLVMFTSSTGVVLQAGLTVATVGATQVTFSPALTVNVPAGSTLTIDPADTVYQATYVGGWDVLVDLANGLLGYASVPPPSTNNPPVTESVLSGVLGLPGGNLAPYRFPALDGIPQDDSGFQTAPVLNPTTNCELGPTGRQIGAVATLTVLVGSGGTIETDTVEVQTRTGTMNGAGTAFTLSTGTLPSGTAAGDLVRITTGANAGSYHVVSSVLSTTSFTVTSAWTLQAGSLSIQISAATSLCAGTGTFSIAGGHLLLIDVAANFLTSQVKAGHTLVQTITGTYARYQVISVLSASQLLLDASTGVVGSRAYRIHSPITSFGGSGSAMEETSVALALEYGVLVGNTSPVRSQVEGVNWFLDTLTTTTLTSSTGSCTGGQPLLIDMGVDFLASDVGSGDYIHVSSGANQGIYRIATVDAAHQVTLTSPLLSTDPAIPYKVRRTSQVSQDSLEKSVAYQAQATQAAVPVQAFQSLVDTPVLVTHTGPATFARLTTLQDVANFAAEVQTRWSYLTTNPTASLEQVLSGGDRLYDKRYVWIDSRINLVTGLVASQVRARQTREQSEVEVQKSLLKLQALG